MPSKPRVSMSQRQNDPAVVYATDDERVKNAGPMIAAIGGRRPSRSSTVA